MTRDKNFLAGVHQLETFADLQFLLGRTVGEALDVLALALDGARQIGIVLLRLLDLVLLYDQRGYSLRPAQRNYGIAQYQKKCHYITYAEKWGFHRTKGLEHNGSIADHLLYSFFEMTDRIVVMSTCGSADEAERLARMLVERRLAACVSVVPGVRSFYRWQGAIESAGEWLLLAKSSRELFPDLAAALQEAHSYEVPEVLALPVTDGSASYLAWLAANLGSEQAQ